MAVVDTTGSSFVFQALFPFPYISPSLPRLKMAVWSRLFPLSGFWYCPLAMDVRDTVFL